MERVLPPPRRVGGVTLAEQLAASSNLRDLLKLRHDEDADGHAQLAAAGRRRTLLDVIRDADDDGAPPVAQFPSSTSGATRRDGVPATTVPMVMWIFF